MLWFSGLSGFRPGNERATDYGAFSSRSVTWHRSHSGGNSSSLSVQANTLTDAFLMAPVASLRGSCACQSSYFQLGRLSGMCQWYDSPKEELDVFHFCFLFSREMPTGAWWSRCHAGPTFGMLTRIDNRSSKQSFAWLVCILAAHNTSCSTPRPRYWTDNSAASLIQPQRNQKI